MRPLGESSTPCEMVERVGSFFLISVVIYRSFPGTSLAIGPYRDIRRRGKQEGQNQKQSPRNTPGKKEVARSPCVSIQHVIENSEYGRMEANLGLVVRRGCTGAEGDATSYQSMGIIISSRHSGI